MLPGSYAPAWDDDKKTPIMTVHSIDITGVLDSRLRGNDTRGGNDVQ